MEFIKGYVFGHYYACDEYCLFKGEPIKGDSLSQGIIYVGDGRNYPYMHVGADWLEKYNDPTKRKIITWVDSNGKPHCDFEDMWDYIDHHNYLFTEDECALGDTPKEAIRQFLVNVDKKVEVYCRPKGRNYFLCVSPLADNKELWDKLLDGCDKVWIYTRQYPYTKDAELGLTEFDIKEEN